MQISGNLAINSGAAFLLAYGAKAENIFWAVHGDIAVGTYAHAEGIMLTYTMIAVHTRTHSSYFRSTKQSLCKLA